MRYCSICVTPDTRPNVDFDERGICSPCRNFARRLRIDWAQRERAFREVVRNAQNRSQGYDCLIPVSGGKDSTWQVVKCLEHGLRPLAVTWKTPARTEIGRRNLENLISLGVDHIDYQVNPEVEKRFMWRAFDRYGSTAIPMHMAIFNIPLKLALKFEIPLVVWGENSAFEYGNGDDEHQGFKLDAEWLRKYGVTHGTSAQDWVGEDFSENDLVAYRGLEPPELEEKGILAIFLGYYFEWDVATSLAVARQHGFQTREGGPKTGIFNFADIDDDFISIHHHLKWYKFGFTRSFDNLSLEIRHGRLSRDGAIQYLKEHGDETPHEDIAKFCAFVRKTPENFANVAERFRNRSIWSRRNGTWTMEDFLIPDWNWQ